MARHFKGNVLDFFGSFYPRISLNNTEDNHKGLSQNSHTSFGIRIWYSRIKVGYTRVGLFGLTDSKYILLRRIGLHLTHKFIFSLVCCVEVITFKC